MDLYKLFSVFIGFVRTYEADPKFSLLASSLQFTPSKGMKLGEA